MAALPPLPSAPRRGGFVTPLAKISLVMAAACVLYSLLQLAVAAALPFDAITEAFDNIGMPIPAQITWVFDHLVALSLVGVLFSLLLLASAWALLRRREWGRWLFIVLLAVAALGNFASLYFLDGMLDGMQAMLPAQLAGTPEAMQFEAQMRVNRVIGMASGAATALAFAALHAWVILKLCSPAIRAEFR